MSFKGIRIGFAYAGHRKIIENIIESIEELIKEGAYIIPISLNKNNLNNRIEALTKNNVINTIGESRNVAQKKLIDIMIIVPCTGDLIAKIANGIVDNPITTCAQYSMASGNKLVIGPYVVDGLSSNACNIGKLLNTKNIYFVPFRQPNPITKPNLISFDKSYIIKTIKKAIREEQIHPILL